jgi:hypothetical protein
MSEITLHDASPTRDRAPLAAGFAEWIRHLPALALVSAAVWVPYQVIQAIVVTALDVPGRAAAIDAMGTRLAAGGSVDSGQLAGAAEALAAYGLVSIVLIVVALSLAQGALSAAAAAGMRGGPIVVSDALAVGVHRLGAVVGVNLLIGLLVISAEVVVAVAAAVLAFALGFARLGAIGTGIGAIALVVAPLLVFALFAVAPQAAALDGHGPVEALRRARASLRGCYWEAVAVVLVTGFVAWIVAVLIGMLAGPAAGHGIAGVMAGIAASAVAAALVGPLPQVVLTALYLSAAGSNIPPNRAIT